MADTLPPFSGDTTTCPKCSHTQAVTRHRAAGEPGSRDPITFGRSPKGERLERECWRCDFVWDEALNPPIEEQEPDSAESPYFANLPDQP